MRPFLEDHFPFPVASPVSPCECQWVDKHSIAAGNVCRPVCRHFTANGSRSLQSLGAYLRGPRALSCRLRYVYWFNKRNCAKPRIIALASNEFHYAFRLLGTGCPQVNTPQMIGPLVFSIGNLPSLSLSLLAFTRGGIGLPIDLQDRQHVREDVR